MYRRVLLLILLFVLPTENKKFNLGRGSSQSRGSSIGRQPQSGAPYPQQHQQYPSYPNQGVNHPQGYPQQPNYNQGAYHPQPNQGVYHQQPNVGYNHGGYQQPNYHVNNPGYQTGFHPGTGPGSVSRGSQWKTALAAGAVGAVGGVLAWEAGKAIIRSATEPAHINGKEYYFNNDDHKYEKKAGELVCTMDLQDLIKQTQQATTTTTASPDSNGTAATNPSPDQLLSSMQFQDGSRPKKVVWTCRAGAEVCCGTECCPAPPPQQQPTPQNGSVSSVQNNSMSLQNILLIVLLSILLMMCCCCFIVYTCFRSAFQNCCPVFNNDNSVPYNDDNKYPEMQSQGYVTNQSNPMQPTNAVPMQTYPNGPGMQQQPVQNGYPAAPGYVYPSQPYNY